MLRVVINNYNDNIHNQVEYKLPHDNVVMTYFVIL
jgi:hypothetical protein